MSSRICDQNYFLITGKCFDVFLMWVGYKRYDDCRLLKDSSSINTRMKKEKSLLQVVRERVDQLPCRLHFNGPTDKTRREWIHFRPFHHNLCIRCLQLSHFDNLSVDFQCYESLSETSIHFSYTDRDEMYQIDSLVYWIRLFHQQICHSQWTLLV